MAFETAIGSMDVGPIHLSDEPQGVCGQAQPAEHTYDAEEKHEPIPRAGEVLKGPPSEKLGANDRYDHEKNMESSKRHDGTSSRVSAPEAGRAAGKLHTKDERGGRTVGGLL